MPRHRARGKKLLQIVFQYCPAVLHITVVANQLMGKARRIVRVVSLLKAVSEPNMNGMAEIRVAETDEARVAMARSLP